MQNYALTTWCNERLLSYEAVVAASAGEAKAFVHGMVTERTRNHTSMLIGLGIRYVVEDGFRKIEELTTHSPDNAIGTLHIVEDAGGARLIWQPSAHLDG